MVSNLCLNGFGTPDKTLPTQRKNLRVCGGCQEVFLMVSYSGNLECFQDHKPSFVPLARYDHLSRSSIAVRLMRREVQAFRSKLIPQLPSRLAPDRVYHTPLSPEGDPLSGSFHLSTLRSSIVSVALSVLCNSRSRAISVRNYHLLTVLGLSSPPGRGDHSPESSLIVAIFHYFAIKKGSVEPPCISHVHAVLLF